MKKLSILLASAAVAAGFTACDSPTDPVLNTEDLAMTLNEPSFAHELFALEDGHMFELEAVQPNYGYAAPAVYSAEVSLTEDFKAFETITPTNAGVAKMEFNDNDLAVALNELFGFDANTYTDQGEIPVYIRAAAEIAGVEGTYVTSNVIKLDKVTFYYAAKSAGQIYLVGQPSGWKRPSLSDAEYYDKWKLEETGAGTGIFTGTFDLKPGESFRFYRTLGQTNTDDDWGKDGEFPSIGAKPNDGTSETIEFTDGVFEGVCVAGKGSWVTPDNMVPGSVLLTVNLNTMTVTFEQGAIDYSKYACIYLVGTPTGWKRPSVGNADDYANFKLYDLQNNGVYVTVEPVALGADSYWRFYEKLGETNTDEVDWGKDGELPSIVPKANDGDNLEVTFTDGAFSGTAVPGKGSWFVKTACNVNMSVDLSDKDAMKVTFTEVEVAE